MQPRQRRRVCLFLGSCSHRKIQTHNFDLNFPGPDRTLSWPRLSVMSGSCFQHYRIGKTCVEFRRKCRRCRPSITRQLIAIPEEFAQPIVPPTAWYSLATFSGHKHRLLILGVHSNQDQTQTVPRPFVPCGHHRCDGKLASSCISFFSLGGSFGARAGEALSWRCHLRVALHLLIHLARQVVAPPRAEKCGCISQAGCHAWLHLSQTMNKNEES